MQPPHKPWYDDLRATAATAALYALLVMVATALLLVPAALDSESSFADLQRASAAIVLGLELVVTLALAAYGWRPTLRRWWRGPERRAPADSTPLVTFRALDGQRELFSLTDEHLKRIALVTGRPGAGKTRLLGAIVRAYLSPHGPDRLHTVTFDANRDLAAHVAWLSLQRGRQPVVIEPGNREHVTGLVLPRRTAGGPRAAAESIVGAWFPWDPETPAQLTPLLLNVFGLLAAGGFGLEQSLRVLLSPGFRDHLLARASPDLLARAGTWVEYIDHLPRPEWHRLAASSFARLFVLLESDPVRLVLGGAAGAFDLATLVDPAYRGPGIDLIVTAGRELNDKERYFVFGILLDELGAVLRLNLDPPQPAAPAPRLVAVIDELGRYGSAGAVLDMMTAVRNVQLRAIGATHSLMTLDARLREKLPVLAANRLAGAEVGEGAQLTASQLAPYDPGLVATAAPDGRPQMFWSAQAQQAKFLHDLQTAPDYRWAVKLATAGPTRWAEQVPGDAPWPTAAELSAALAAAARASGRPVAEVRQELDRQNAGLDQQFGSIDRQLVERLVRAAPDDTWAQRPDDDFAPY